MNNSQFVLVFLSGVVVAVVTILLSDYLQSMRPSNVGGKPKNLVLPDTDYLSLIDEESETFFHMASEFGTQLQKSKPREVQNWQECDAEAMKTLAAALSSKKSGHKRANKLFQHAVTLCPKHPKILNHYGEFLEDQGPEDLLQADHLFVRAISYAKEDSEEHERALQNRKRTSLLVDEIDRRVLHRIDDKKKAFQRISDSNSALKRAKKEAYFQHIYHTVGIEGNTMSLGQTRSILETKLAVPGKSIFEHNEVLGLDAALKYINQTLVDKVGEITLDDILQIHKRVIGHVDPIEAGMIRRTQVYVGDYVPPKPSHIDLLLQRFVMWLNSPENFEMHPVRFAALSHYKLVYIHPFVDGNGRTSRLLMNLILMQHGYPPVIIRKQDRLEYYKHLVTANEGDIRPFVRFIAECTERTLDAYIASTAEDSGGPGLVPFQDEDMTIPTQDHFDHHDKIIMGGMVGANITVSP